jgi:O-antigen/teichoic acid export membrane protein
VKGRTGGKGVKDTLGIFGARFIWSGMGLVSGIALARYLGPQNRGILAVVVQLIPSTIVTLVKLGVSQATVYYVNRKEASVGQVASNSVALAFLLGGVSVAIVWLLRGSMSTTILKDVPDWALAVALVRVPLLLLDNYLYGVLQATGQFGMYNTRLLMSELVKLVLVGVFVMYFDLGLPAAIWIFTAISLFNMAWLLATMRRRIHFTFALDLKLLKNMLSFGVRSYMQVVIAYLLLRIDAYMVQAQLGPEQTAFYSLAVHLTETVLEVPQAIGLVLYPRLAALGEEEIHRLTAQTCRRTLLLTAPAALGLAFLGPHLIRILYSAAFAPAGAPLPWLAVGIVAMAIFVIITRDFTARSQQVVNTVSGIVALIINVTLNIYLIPRYGIVGAAFATAVAYITACIILLGFFCRESGLSWTSVLIPRLEDVRYFVSLARRGLAHVPDNWPLVGRRSAPSVKGAASPPKPDADS